MRQQGNPYRMARLPEMAYSGRTISQTRGFLKMLIDERGNRVPSITNFIAGGGDLIVVVQMAMLSGMEFPALRDAIFAQPTVPIFAQPTVPEGVNRCSRTSR